MKAAQSPCRRELLFDLLEDSLPPEQSIVLTAHVETCPACLGEMERLAAAPQVWNETQRVLSDVALVATSQVCRTSSTHPGSRKRDLREQDVQNATQAGPKQERDQLRALLPLLSESDDEESLGRLDHYEIRSIVGWGGMGVVLRAFDPTLSRTVAIKVLHPHLAAHGAARRRFAREAKAAAAVNHPSVVPIHSVNADAQPPYLVMSYVPGGSLQDRIDREGPLDTTDVLRIGIQIADALSAAHTQGLVHRDVKPGNILLDHGQNRVLLTDFGLAQALDDATLTASGALAGTPQYMSPEQARGETVDPRGDLFSLGGVLYAMTTGRPPFRGESTLAILHKIGNSDPKPIREIVPEAPEWLERAIAHLQAKEVEHRPTSASAVATMLRECLAHARRPIDNPLPVTLPPRKDHDLLLPPSKPSTKSQGYPLLAAIVIALAGCVLLPLIVGGAYLALTRPKGAESGSVLLLGPEVVSDVTQSSSGDRLPNKQTWQTALPNDTTRWNDGLDAPLSELQGRINSID